MIVGDPGAGKTTLLLRLAVQLAEQQVPGLTVIPIYLKLHALAQQATIDLFQVALASVCMYGFPTALTEPSLIELMQQGKVLSQTKISALTRSYIALLLTQVGDDNLVSPLLRLFEDPALEEGIRAAIAHTLVIIGDEKIRSRLLDLVADSRVSNQIGREIVQAFSSVEENTTIAQLHQLEDMPTISTALKQEIVLTLGILGDSIALTMLIQALQQIHSEVWDDDILMAMPIIVSIVRYGTLDQMKALLYDAHYASQVRIRLLDYLPDLVLAQQQSLIYILIDIISNRTIIESVRHGAIWALGQIGNTSEVVERLIACLPRSSSIDEIYRALWRVSRRAGVRVIPYGPGGTQLRVWNW